MRIAIGYGHSSLSIDLPEEAEVMKPSFPTALPHVSGAVRTALAAPLGAPPLAESLAPHDRVAIVFSPRMPVAANAMLAAELLGAVEAHGVPRERITLIIGHDLEVAVSESDPILMLGHAYRVVVHDPRDPDALLFQRRYAGERRAGIYLNEAYQEASVRILTGPVLPHFAGGWSHAMSVVPGVAAGHNALRTLSVANLLHPESRPGNAAGNPIFDEAAEVGEDAGVTLACWLTLDARGTPTGVFAGGFRESIAAAIEAEEGAARINAAPAFDLVVAGASGTRTLQAAIPALATATEAVTENGTIVLAAECADGLGGESFASTLRSAATPEELWTTLLAPEFVQDDQWSALALAAARHKAAVLLCSALDSETVRSAHLLPTTDVTRVVAEFTASFHLRTGHMPTIGVLPEAGRSIVGS
ncbi:MAG TPA: lactate racemase domain-containing protein [Dehalococcoidia bacterium]|nr:lactate racemase domain-containing protein [Dehalococcoidia bacterium]